MSNFVSIEDEASQRVYDVIIVGAGVSGMQTAYSLVHEHGVAADKILLLEAQDYIGGRVRQSTDFVKNVKVELGAEILHGKNTALTHFAERVGQPIDQIFTWAHGDGGPLDMPVNDGYGLYYVGKGKQEGQSEGRLLRFDDRDDDFVKVNEEIANLAHMDAEQLSDAASLKEFLLQRGHSEEMIGMADAGFANTLCIDIDQLSLKQSVNWSRLWHAETKDEGDYKFRNSFSCLVDYLKAELHILTQKPVTHVTINDAAEKDNTLPRVTIRCEDKSEYRAHAVVMATSLHVLQSKMIEFSPPLEKERDDALQWMIMRPAAKVFVKFRELCWPEKLQGMIISDPDMLFPEIWFRDVRTLRGEGEEAAGYATGFATSRWAERIASMTEKEVYEEMCNQLEKMFSHLQPRHLHATLNAEGEQQSSEGDSAEGSAVFPPKASSVFISGRIQQWNAKNTRFIGGGFCAPRAGFPTNAVDVLTAPVQDALFFAGEAMMQPAGTAHAAMDAGVRAAKQVKQALSTRGVVPVEAPAVAEAK